MTMAIFPFPAVTIRTVVGEGSLAIGDIAGGGVLRLSANAEHDNARDRDA